jgi:hypothetical protein
MIDKGLTYAYPLRFAEGGDVKAVWDAAAGKTPTALARQLLKLEPRSGITRARDSSGEVIPGMFVAQYADGTYSAPGTPLQTEHLRQGIISGEVTTGAYSAAEAAKMAEKSTYLKTNNLHVVDEDVSARPGATTNEAIGNDTVFVAFSDGSRSTVQKGMIDALNQYGLLDDVKSRDNFNKVVQAVSAAVAQQPNSNLAQAHSLFNTKQIAYNDALMQANPQLAQNRLAFVQQYAPDNQAALAAAQAQVDSVAPPPIRPNYGGHRDQQFVFFTGPDGTSRTYSPFDGFAGGSMAPTYTPPVFGDSVYNFSLDAPPLPDFQYQPAPLTGGPETALQSPPAFQMPFGYQPQPFAPVTFPQQGGFPFTFSQYLSPPPSSSQTIQSVYGNFQPVAPPPDGKIPTLPPVFQKPWMPTFPRLPDSSYQPDDLIPRTRYGEVVPMQQGIMGLPSAGLT